MDRDPFGHRKYHGLYFILGFLIAFVAFMMLSGCEKGRTTSGKDCVGMVGMTWQGDQCEPVDVWVDRPPTDPPVMCCMALTPSCEACQEGISLPEWMENTCGPIACDVEYAGWDDEAGEPIWLCQAIIID